MTTATVPEPVPVAPSVMVTQSRFDVALQAHWLVVVTPMVVDAPEPGTDIPVTDSV
jgi:hypothetical protein